MFILHKRLKHIKLKLKEWNKNEFGNIFEAKTVVDRKLHEINQILITDDFNEGRKEQVEHHQWGWEELCKQEEILWKHKSRVQWLKEGERNTRFFHKSTMDHRSHNRLSIIKDSQGEKHNTQKDIEAASVHHFEGITEEPLVDRSQFINDFTKHIPKLVTREENYNLNRPVNEKEVIKVIKEMQNGKAPSPDGFNVDFFKAWLGIFKWNILNVVEDSRKNKTILKALNTSFMSLIRKLNPLLPTLTSEEQTGYVEGRKVLNKIIQAHEVVHSLKRNTQAGMIVQLDLEKAYDKLSCAYIRRVLIAYGFDHNWVRWVMALVTFSSFSILLNGSPYKPFNPTRGHTKEIHSHPSSLFS
eukprot:PITA_31791